MRIAFYTSLALIAFASNSVLCRLALGENSIDAASFTAIRLISGVVVLAIIFGLSASQSSSNSNTKSRGSWRASAMLFLYAITFSYAYLLLETGTGALILFASVQITMVLVDIISGNRPRPIEWVGMIVAFLGFIYLVAPGVSAPSPIGLILMVVSGIAWGFYTLAGRGSSQPLADTTFNFLRTLPLVAILVLATFSNTTLSTTGIVLAILSGGIASGTGYSIWYMALGGLSATQAAVVQLLVPIIAALGGVLFAAEPLHLRLVLASATILGGVLILILGKQYTQKSISD